LFYLSYVFSELARRRTRTVLTALGLGVGIALVVTVNALSTGLDRAQSQVLSPLTGIGTDMSVSRPIKLSGSGFNGLSPAQRSQLRKQNGGAGFGLRNLGKAGSHFSRDRFAAAGNLGFGQSRVTQISKLSTVESAAGSLTLNSVHVSGTVPKPSGGARQGFGPGGPGGPAGGGLQSINFSSTSVTGVDQTKSSIAAVTPGQIVRGRYFSARSGSYQSILSASYANSQGLGVGSKMSLGGKSFTVVGIASSPIGGTASDVYVELQTLQKVAGSGWTSQVTGVQVRVKNSNEVSTTATRIKKVLSGAQVTTAQDLAKRVGGSLTDAKNLAGSLGKALEIVGLLAAFLIAVLLTLASVAKRTREIGTLRAFGWSKGLVVRQISLETVIQGALGGLAGAAIGATAAGAITLADWTLKATVASTPSSGGGFPGGPFGLGQATVTAGSAAVHITAPVDLSLVLVAVLIAVLSGVLIGGIGGLRAARLRPAEALRNLE
jgi:putative ABC transport system permease protein